MRGRGRGSCRRSDICGALDIYFSRAGSLSLSLETSLSFSLSLSLSLSFSLSLYLPVPSSSAPYIRMNSCATALYMEPKRRTEKKECGRKTAVRPKRMHWMACTVEGDRDRDRDREKK